MNAAASLTTVPGKLRVYLEALPEAGAWDMLLQRLGKRHREQAEHGLVVVVHAGAGDAAALSHLPKFIQTRVHLLDEDAVPRLLALAPARIILPRLVAPELDEADHAIYSERILQILQSGMILETTLSLVAFEEIKDILRPSFDWPQHAKLSGTYRRRYVTEYILVDVPPQTLLTRYLRGELPLVKKLAQKRPDLLNLSNLYRMREAMLKIVGLHAADQARQLAIPGEDLGEDSKSSLDWQWHPPEAMAAVLVMLGAVGLGVPLYVMEMLSATSLALGLMGLLVLMALRVNTMSLLVGGLAGFMGYLAVLGMFSANLAVQAPAFGDALMMALLLAVTMLTVSWRRSQTEQQRLDDRYTRALMRLVYDSSHTESVEDMIELAQATLRRTLGYEVAYVALSPLGAPNWEGRTDLSRSEREDLVQTVQSGAIQAPTAEGGYTWSPIATNEHFFGMLGVRRANRKPVYGSMGFLAFLRSYSRLMSAALWRMQLQQDRNHAGELANRETLRSSLLASVSHDLKTPLVSIIGSLSTLQFVRDGLPPQERQDLIKAALQEAERLHRIVHNVLEMAKLESGMTLTSTASLELAELIRLSGDRLRRSYPWLKVELEDRLDGQAVPGDELLLAQVFYNLLENAAKYGREDTPVKVRLDQTAKPTLVVEVSNEGAVIPAHELSQVFDKYFRSQFTDSKRAGSGLGLAICKAIVEAHNGTITAFANPTGPAGMTFRVELPLAPRSMLADPHAGMLAAAQDKLKTGDHP